jgi:hypothetical protein
LPGQDGIPALPTVTDTGRDAGGDLRGYRNLLDCLAEGADGPAGPAGPAVPVHVPPGAAASALSGGLDFTRSPEGLAQLVTD